MPSPRLSAVLLILLLGLLAAVKSRVESCTRDSGAAGLSCDRKIVVDMAVPSGSSGGEASLVAQIAGSKKDTQAGVQVIRDPPVISINKSDVYAAYALTYLRAQGCCSTT